MEFSHFDGRGNARMVDVSSKEETCREAVACGSIRVGERIFRAVMDKRVAKGDVFSVAVTAGIMAAKRTWELIPMCHILPLEHCSISFEPQEEDFTFRCLCTVRITGKTGVEMEALTGVSVALLTVYDMCKAIDKGMEIGEICLLKKSGGKSGIYEKKGGGSPDTGR